MKAKTPKRMKTKEQTSANYCILTDDEDSSSPKRRPTKPKTRFNHATFGMGQEANTFELHEDEDITIKVFQPMDGEEPFYKITTGKDGWSFDNLSEIVDTLAKLVKLSDSIIRATDSALRERQAREREE